MRQIVLITANELKQSDLVFLNDLKAFERHQAFYIDHSHSEEFMRDDHQLPQIGQVLKIEDLENASKRNQSSTPDQIHLSVRTSDGRILDLVVDAFQKFSKMIPATVEARHLKRGMIVYMRGDYSPLHLTSNYSYGLIALKYGCESRVLRVRRSLFGNRKVIVLFGGVKKISVTVEKGAIFEVSRGLEKQD